MIPWIEFCRFHSNYMYSQFLWNCLDYESIKWKPVFESFRNGFSLYRKVIYFILLFDHVWKPLKALNSFFHILHVCWFFFVCKLITLCFTTFLEDLFFIFFLWKQKLCVSLTLSYLTHCERQISGGNFCAKECVGKKMFHLLPSKNTSLSPPLHLSSTSAQASSTPFHLSAIITAHYGSFTQYAERPPSKNAPDAECHEIQTHE